MTPLPSALQPGSPRELTKMSDSMAISMLALTAIGFFCAGFASQQRRVLYWRIKWIELEHDSARAEGREPRDIKSVVRKFEEKT